MLQHHRIITVSRVQCFSALGPVLCWARDKNCDVLSLRLVHHALQGTQWSQISQASLSTKRKKYKSYMESHRKNETRPSSLILDIMGSSCFYLFLSQDNSLSRFSPLDTVDSVPCSQGSPELSGWMPATSQQRQRQTPTRAPVKPCCDTDGTELLWGRSRVMETCKIQHVCNVTMQCNAMQCNAMQCNAMQCNAMQCNAMQCNVGMYACMQCMYIYIYMYMYIYIYKYVLTHVYNISYLLILKVANTKFALLDLSGRFQHFHQALQNFIRRWRPPLGRRSRRWPRTEQCSAAKTGRSSGSAAGRPRSPLHLASAHSPTPKAPRPDASRYIQMQCLETSGHTYMYMYIYIISLLSLYNLYIVI